MVREKNSLLCSDAVSGLASQIEAPVSVEEWNMFSSFIF
jgi:hypothetical protein